MAVASSSVVEHFDVIRQITPRFVSSSAPDLNGFLVWLEGVLATAHAISPTVGEIQARSGAAAIGVVRILHRTQVHYTLFRTTNQDGLPVVDQGLFTFS